MIAHRFDAALKHLGRAIDMSTHPCMEVNSHKLTLAECHVFRAKLFWALGLREAGTKDMTIAMSLAPDHIEVRRFHDALQLKASELYSSASYHMVRGCFPLAIPLLTAAIRIVPDDIKLLLTRAAAYRQVGTCELALEDLEKASLAYRSIMWPESDILSPYSMNRSQVDAAQLQEPSFIALRLV